MKADWPSRWKPGDRVLCPHYSGQCAAVLIRKKPSIRGCWYLRKHKGDGQWTGIVYHNEHHTPFQPDPDPLPLPPDLEPEALL